MHIQTCIASRESTWLPLHMEHHAHSVCHSGTVTAVACYTFTRHELKDLDELLPDLLLSKLHLHASLIQLLATPSGPGSHTARALTVSLVLLQAPTTRSSSGPLVFREVQPLLGTLQPPNQLA